VRGVLEKGEAPNPKRNSHLKRKNYSQYGEKKLALIKANSRGIGGEREGLPFLGWDVKKKSPTWETEKR